MLVDTVVPVLLHPLTFYTHFFVGLCSSYHSDHIKSAEVANSHEFNMNFGFFSLSINECVCFQSEEAEGDLGGGAAAG